MKTMTKWLALILVTAMLLTCLVSCGSSFAKIKKNFEKAGYTYVTDGDENTAKTLTAEFEKGDIDCTVHLFKTSGLMGIPVYAIVLEFDSDKELKKAFDESASETLKGFMKDLEGSEYVRDNCVLIAVTATKQSEMKDIFNK